jgi:hypothetical protein
MHKETQTHTNKDGCFKDYEKLDMQLILGKYMESEDRKKSWEATTRKTDRIDFNSPWY